MSGRMIFQVERVGVGVERAPHLPAPAFHRVGSETVTSMQDSERDRIFSDWLADHKGILFKVVNAYAFEHADRQDLFQEIAIQVAMMIATRERNVVTGWDFAISIVGAAAALLAGGAMYVNRRGQERREQRFGESLRDQLNRRIAQLDDRATRARLTSELVLVVMGGICPMALVLLGLRVNQQSFRDNGFLIVSMIVMCVGSVAAGVWANRRQIHKEVLPRKHRLEALELEAP